MAAAAPSDDGADDAARAGHGVGGGGGVYMRFLHVGVCSLSYGSPTAASSGACWTRCLRRTRSSPRAARGVDTAAAAEGGGGGGGGSGGGGISEVIRAVSAVSSRIPDVTGVEVRFNTFALNNVHTTVGALAEQLSAWYTRGALRQMYKIIGAAEILGNPTALLTKLGDGVIEFFRAPADGFLSDGLLGLGLGINHGVRALVVGALSGFFGTGGFFDRLSGAFARVGGIDTAEMRAPTPLPPPPPLPPPIGSISRRSASSSATDASVGGVATAGLLLSRAELARRRRAYWTCSPALPRAQRRSAKALSWRARVLGSPILGPSSAPRPPPPRAERRAVRLRAGPMRRRHADRCRGRRLLVGGARARLRRPARLDGSGRSCTMGRAA